MVLGQGGVRSGDLSDEDPCSADVLLAAHQRQQDRHRAPLRPAAQADVAPGRQGNGRQVCYPNLNTGLVSYSDTAYSDTFSDSQIKILW